MSSTDPMTGMTILEAVDCWKLLREADVGRLAVSIAGHPDIFPINHIVNDGAVMFRCQAGTKLAAAVLGQSVAFEIDGYDAWTGDAWSVVVKGRAIELEKYADIDAAESLPLFSWAAFPKPHWVRIEPDEITGRRFHVVN
ncbi:MAG: pyridoxamine 5'-phosphate oxidase family protein [Acidimicrobiia bacterium]